MKNMFIRSIPLLLAFLAGLSVFAVAMFVLKEGNIYDIFIEVSGALIGIPFVFFIYDYTEYIISAKLNKTINDSITFEINSIISVVLRQTKEILGIKKEINWDMIQKMLNMKNSEIKKSLTINKQTGTVLRQCKDKLTDLLYRGENVSVMTPEHLQTIVQISKVLSVTAADMEYRKSNRDAIVADIKNLFRLIDQWFDLSEAEALKEHKDFVPNIEMN